MAARKTTAKKPATKRKMSKKAQQQAQRNAQWSIVLFAAAALLLAVTFVRGENAWAWVRTNVLFGVFGVCSYLVAPLLIYIAVLLARNCEVKKPIFKGILLLLLISGTVLAFTDTTALQQMNFQRGVEWLHANGAATAEGTLLFSGGVLSSVLGWSLLKLAGTLGARIILVLLTLAGVMYITLTTPQDIYEFCASKVEVARENVTQYTTVRRERAEQRRINEENSMTGTHRLFDYDKEGFDEKAFTKARATHKTQVNTQAPQARAYIDVDLGPSATAIQKQNAAPDPIAVGPGGTFGQAAVNEVQHRQTVPTQEVPPVVRPIAPLPDETKTPAAPLRREDPVDLDSLVRKAARPAIVEESNDQLKVVAAAESDAQGAYIYPPLSLFEQAKAESGDDASEEMHNNAQLLTQTLESFGVKTRVLDISRGPSVTRYELQPLAGVKVSRITGLADDIALNLAATGVRIEAPIPGKAAVGIEVPNKSSSAVRIRSILQSSEFIKSTSPLTMALGQDIAGKNRVANLAKMPHLLIAGSTGSGKSVCINSIIMSFLYKSSPEDLKLIMIDPKMVELMDYNGIPHLVMPVVTEPRKAAGALGSAVAEMEKRYKIFADTGVRNIEAYNEWALNNDEEKMPYMAIIIDELADLMMVAGKEVEDYICRIAQKARAAGMHLIVATQRPSVDVITGLIKANIPSRIAFAVSSQIDSRTILDSAGAEKLLGKGDMLFMPVGASKPVRIQGTYVHDDEIKRVLDFIKKNSSPDYDESMMRDTEKCTVSEKNNSAESADGNDAMFDSAVEVVIDAGQASTSLLQRRLKLGYARAARIMDEMEQAHIIGPYEGSKPRQVLISRNQWMEKKMQAADNANEAADDAPF